MNSFGVLRPPPQIIFGHGATRVAGQVAREYGNRVLLCTDVHLASSPALNRVRQSLRDHNLTTAIYADCVPDVPVETLAPGLAFAGSHKPEVIVAVGGGSVIDYAKVVALLLRHPGPISDYYGEGKVPGRGLCVVALPTTAGTGSEVTPVAVLTDPGRLLKVGVSSPHLTPVCAICDPALLASCPPSVAAHAGIDALAHAIESYTAIRRSKEIGRGLGDRVFIGKNDLSDPMALAAIERIGRGLVPMVHRNDEEARELMSLGSLLAGLAFATAGTTAAHALQYPVGARTATPHGLGVGVLLPYAMTFNLPFREAEFATIATLLGEGADPGAAPQIVASLCQTIGVPSTLAAIGVAEDELAEIANDAAGITRLVENNPRPLDEESLLTIAKAAWYGDRGLVEEPMSVP
jgi:alcohol dehydrogenase class IV